jgi:hypothetical protein
VTFGKGRNGGEILRVCTMPGSMVVPAHILPLTWQVGGHRLGGSERLQRGARTHSHSDFKAFVERRRTNDMRIG